MNVAHKLSLVLSLLAVAAHAGQPLLRLTNTSGFVPPEYVKTEVCDVYDEGVVITRKYGVPNRAVFVEKKSTLLSGEISALIAEASQATLEEGEELPCDGPSTVIETFSTDKPVVLFASRGCGSKVQTRAGAAASILRKIVKASCPEGWAP